MVRSVWCPRLLPPLYSYYMLLIFYSSPIHTVLMTAIYLTCQCYLRLRTAMPLSTSEFPQFTVRNLGHKKGDRGVVGDFITVLYIL